jgi:simple sugar transport system permease protein
LKKQIDELILALPSWVFLPIAIILSLIIFGVILVVNDKNPILVYHEIIITGFGSYRGLSETLTTSIPLILAGVGLSIAYKANLWNIGAEGQLYMGAIGAGIIAYEFSPTPVSLIGMFIFGFLFGGVWGLIPALLKRYYEVNEIITTLMMNYIAIHIMDYLVFGRWRDPTTFGFPFTPLLPDNMIIPRLLPGSRLHATVIIAIFASIAIYLLMYKTTEGYEIRVYGGNPEAARYSGINITKVLLLSMFLSGALAGIAGVGEFAGIHRRLTTGFSKGYGYTAILIAWLGSLNPIYVMVAAILFSGFVVGLDALQISIGLPFASIYLFEGILLIAILIREYAERVKARYV